MAKLKTGINRTAAQGGLSKKEMDQGFKKLSTVSPLESGKGPRSKDSKPELVLKQDAADEKG